MGWSPAKAAEAGWPESRLPVRSYQTCAEADGLRPALLTGELRGPRGGSDMQGGLRGGGSEPVSPVPRGSRGRGLPCGSVQWVYAAGGNERMVNGSPSVAR